MSKEVAQDHRRDISYFLKMGESPTRAKLDENLGWKYKGKFNLSISFLTTLFFLLFLSF